MLHSLSGAFRGPMCPNSAGSISPTSSVNLKSQQMEARDYDADGRKKVTGTRAST